MFRIFKNNILKEETDLKKVVLELGNLEEKISIKVSGTSIKKKGIIKVSKGTTLLEIFEKLEGDKEALSKIIQDGTFNGIQRSSLNEKILGFEKELTFLTEKEENRGKEEACIRCAKCLRICKKGLNPIKLVDIYKKREKDEFLKFGGSRCTECGLCTYVCPSNIELSHKIKTGKNIFK